jgi:hypothetical protein
MRKALGLAALAIATITLSACGGSVSVGVGTKTLNSGELEASLAKQLAPQGGVKPSDITMSCPDDIPVKKGHAFDCTLTVKSDQSKVTVNVTETNDKGHVSATVPDPAAAKTS